MRLLCLGVLGLVVGCSSSIAEETSSSSDAIALDRLALPTLRTTLNAGDAYSPFSDERPMLVGDRTCLERPSIEMTPGATEISASVITSRRDLMNRLDLGIEGVPVNIGKLSGATGTARLAIDTELSERSLNLMFQAKGTYETTLAGVGSTPSTFDPRNVSQCGWGYVNRAYHRLSAIVLVTVEASDGSSRIRVGCAEGEKDCTPASIGAGPVQAQAALERMLKSGHYNVRVGSVADIIPSLQATPLGDITTMASTPETSGEVVAKLGSALNWLGTAQSAIAKTIDDIRREPEQRAPAPTIKVDFTYWPGLEASLRDRAGSTYDRIAELRKDYELTMQRAEKWDAFADEHAAGFGYLYQTPALPAGTTAEIERRESEARAVLVSHRNDLDRRLGECEDASRNLGRVAGADALVSALETACRPVPAVTWAPRWDVRRLAPISIALKPYDEWGDHMCPDGQRIPKAEEASLLAPWSHESTLWVTREWFGANPRFVSKGKVERVGLFQAPSYVTACFDAAAPTLFD